MDPKDREHITQVLAQLPMTPERLSALVSEYTDERDADREGRFRGNLAWLEAQLTR